MKLPLATLIETSAAIVLNRERLPEAASISTDTRVLEPGELYVALRGENFDGHAFVGAALERGACGVVVSDPAVVPAGAPALVVAETLAAYHAFAACARAGLSAPVVAVTGSAGKTTTKEFIGQLLEAAGFAPVATTPANENNEFGVPKLFLGLEPNVRAARRRGRDQHRRGTPRDHGFSGKTRRDEIRDLDDGRAAGAQRRRRRIERARRVVDARADLVRRARAGPGLPAEGARRRVAGPRDARRARTRRDAPLCDRLLRARRTQPAERRSGDRRGARGGRAGAGRGRTRSLPRAAARALRARPRRRARCDLRRVQRLDERDACDAPLVRARGRTAQDRRARKHGGVGFRGAGDARACRCGGGGERACGDVGRRRIRRRSRAWSVRRRFLRRMHRRVRRQRASGRMAARQRARRRRRAAQSLAPLSFRRRARRAAGDACLGVRLPSCE